MTLDDVRRFLETATDLDRQTILQALRQEFGLVIHPLEAKWKTTAEAILEAIDQSSDLTQRGIRGVLAEAIFRTVVVPRRLKPWTNEPPSGDVAYDLLLDDGSQHKPLRVQVKLQRRLKGKPMLYQGNAGVYVVETQRTRTGKKRRRKDAKLEGRDTDKPETQATRPYRVDDFDLLAVCLQPSSGEWEDFVYCASKDLMTRQSNGQLLEVLQPIQIATGLVDSSKPFTKEFERAARRARGLE